MGNIGECKKYEKVSGKDVVRTRENRCGLTDRKRVVQGGMCAYPMRRPGGAVTPAMKDTTGFFTGWL
jgi:hypothetical protein